MSDVRRLPIMINKSTPLVVINGLADAYNIEGDLLLDDNEETITQLVDTINTTSISVPTKGWNNEIYGLVAQFVNLDSRQIWRKDRLLIAYQDILNFNVANISRPFRFSHRCNKYPTSLDPVACYLICRHHQITLHRETTYVEMATLINLLTMSRIERGLVGSDITNLSLVKYITTNNAELKYDNNAHALVKNNIEAIHQAIVNWKIDLSLSEYPLIDYYGNYGKVHFRPITESLIKINKINQFRLKFGTYFNREIPLKYYTNEILNKFYIIEGVDKNPLVLIEQSVYNTFHHLLQPEVKETETSFLMESLDDINPLELISYGVLSTNYNEFVNNTMKIYSLDELIAMFKSQKNFVDSITGEKFSNEAVNKLTNICLGLISNNRITAEIKQKAKDLKNAIEMINLRQKGLDSKIKSWMDVADGNKIVIDALNALLDAGMYMRSWKGPPHPYPVNRSEVDRQDIIDRNTSLALIKFHEVNSQLDPLIRVDQLPLVKYFKGHFVESDSKYEGYTINDRIEIVNRGNNTREMSSCIRMSSNFIIASAYRYLQILGNTPSFSINTLIDVS